MQLRKIALTAIGLFFIVNAIMSGNPAAILVALGLSGICFYVVITGKVHKKYTRSADRTSPMKNYDDEQFLAFFANVKKKLTGGSSGSLDTACNICDEHDAECLLPTPDTVKPGNLPQIVSKEAL